MPFTIKRNDTSPVLQTVLTDPSGNVIDLTAADVRFHMKQYRSSTAKIDAEATVVDEDAGLVRYEWEIGDTDTVGSYQAEFEVSFIDGTVETFPNADFIQVDIIYDLA
jgi:hypothetical protein